MYSLARLMAERDMSVKYMAAKAEATLKAPVESIKAGIGTRLVHKKFGVGTVLSLNKGIAKIMFSDGHGVKSIDLAVCSKNGIIKPE